MPLVIVPLAILLTAFVAYGTAFLARSQGSAWANWVKDALGATFLVGDFLTQAAVSLTKWIAHEVGAHFGQVEGQTVQWLAALGNAIDYSAQSIAGIAYDLHRFSRWLVLQEIPKLIHALPNSVTHLVHSITTRVVTVERTVVKIPKLTKAQIRAAIAVAIPGIIAPELPYLEWLKNHLKQLERAAAGAAAGTIAGVLDWERGVGGRLNRDITGLRKRIGKLEKLSAGTIAAGAVALALARLGLSWIRCENNKKVGKAICGLPSNLLNDVLGLLTDAVILTNICTIIPLMEQGFELVEAPLAEFTSGALALACAGKYPGGPALTIPALQLPVSPLGVPALQLP